MSIIDIVRQQLHKGKILLEFLHSRTTAMTVVFIAAMALVNAFLIHAASFAPGSYRQFADRLSAQAIASTADVSGYSDAGSLQTLNAVDGSVEVSADNTRFIVLSGDALLAENNPLSSSLPSRDGLMTYTIRRGDTLSSIAANFGISLNTILWANSGISARSLTPGKDLVILPVTGVVHQVQEGETLDSIANLYGVSRDAITRVNPAVASGGLSAVSSLIIPNGRPTQNEQLSSLTHLPSYPGYFSIPTTGWNWGILHNYNAVDIANACGTPIYAAAEGLVTESLDSGWNGGYGGYVMIEHPNGTKTRYAHIEKTLVSVGDYVAKGDEIALMGNTGLTHGPTGCHLHFEVYGAKNPFAK
ncbi:MAG: peptidoglycan DD-metalloendopeptidase family protein [Patescibacteria group bacterium]|nr:peptidoglycan DD-metalloendopeptidase family protein [Patescibacteria group bacterium]